MYYCDECRLSLSGDSLHCPLCHSTPRKTSEHEGVRETFPRIPTTYRRYRSFFRLLMILSVAISATSFVWNCLFPRKINWSVFVLMGFTYMWFTIVTSVRQKFTIPKKIIYQVIGLGAISVGVDLLTGNHHWALNYAVPSLCIAANFAIPILLFVSGANYTESLIYIFSTALIGLIPLIFIITRLVTNDVMSDICVVVSVFSLMIMLKFYWPEFKAEAEKRFHV